MIGFTFFSSSFHNLRISVAKPFGINEDVEKQTFLHLVGGSIVTNFQKEIQ